MLVHIHIHCVTTSNKVNISVNSIPVDNFLCPDIWKLLSQWYHLMRNCSKDTASLNYSNDVFWLVNCNIFTFTSPQHLGAFTLFFNLMFDWHKLFDTFFFLHLFYFFLAYCPQEYLSILLLVMEYFFAPDLFCVYLFPDTYLHDGLLVLL